MFFFLEHTGLKKNYVVYVSDFKIGFLVLKNRLFSAVSKNFFPNYKVNLKYFYGPG
jgi:hypothetical protein